MREHSSVRGQSTIDYAALLLVVVVVLTTATAAWGDARALAGTVPHAIARALCIVRGGDCDADARPCVTAADERRTEAVLRLAVLRLGGARGLLRETRSDGSVALTFGTLLAPGVALGAGAEGRIAIGSLRIGAGASVEGVVSALFEHARTWVLRDRRAADRLQATLEHGEPAGTPDAGYDARGLSTTLDLRAGAGVLEANVGIGARDVRGVRVDRASGRRTLLVARTNTLGVSLSALELGANGEAAATERYAVTLDRDGRPLDLAILREGSLQASADLPPRLRAVAGLLKAPTQGGRAWSEEVHLDLTDAADLALARDFLAQVTGASVTRPGARLTVARALQARLDAVGVVDARTYAIDADETAAGATIGAGLRIGGSWSRVTIHRRLVGAATRGLDGLWRARGDCVAA